MIIFRRIPAHVFPHLQKVLPCTARFLGTSAYFFQSVKPDLKTQDVLNASMKYVDTEANKERLVVFLHGNPTSSYLWRNIIPHVQNISRCVAPDLIGMGQSEKLRDISYTFDDHYKYLSEWMRIISGDQKVNLVIHDWGSALGFHWANQNRDRVESITHMESLVAPIDSWDHFPEGGRKIFQAMRSEGGEDMILNKNIFVERILVSSIQRKLSDEEMEAYREPFKNQGEERRPTLTWPRQIPVKGDGPENVIRIVEDYNAWLSQSKDLPKLYINANPGFFAPWIEEKTKSWPNHAKISVSGLHFLQEDSPKQIGRAICAFLKDKVFV